MGWNSVYRRIFPAPEATTTTALAVRPGDGLREALMRGLCVSPFANRLAEVGDLGWNGALEEFLVYRRFMAAVTRAAKHSEGRSTCAICRRFPNWNRVWGEPFSYPRPLGACQRCGLRVCRSCGVHYTLFWPAFSSKTERWRMEGRVRRLDPNLSGGQPFAILFLQHRGVDWNHAHFFLCSCCHATDFAWRVPSEEKERTKVVVNEEKRTVEVSVFGAARLLDAKHRVGLEGIRLGVPHQDFRQGVGERLASELLQLRRKGGNGSHLVWDRLPPTIRRWSACGCDDCQNNELFSPPRAVPSLFGK